MTRVSICLPVRNGAATVERAIRSALNQTHRDIELVISDNASDDGTTEICLGYAAADPRVRYLRQEVPLGIEENILRVLEDSEGPYCMFFGHDDELAPRYAALLSDLLDRYPGAVLAGGAVNQQVRGGDYRIIRYAGRQAVADLSLFSRALVYSTRRSLWRSYLKPTLFVVGLFRREALVEIWKEQMGWFFSERNILLEATFMGDFVYCDEVLFTKNTSKKSHVLRNSADPFVLRKRSIEAAPRRYGCEVIWRLLRSPRIPMFRKILVPFLLPWVVLRRFGLGSGVPV